jgi:hypothetical protein
MEMTLTTDIVWHDFYVSTIDAEIAKGWLMTVGGLIPCLSIGRGLLGIGAIRSGPSELSAC